MQVPLLPEIQVAVENLQASISRAEKELEQLAEVRKQKKAQIRDWRKALKVLNGRGKDKDARGT
jgi:cell division protein FtsB